jgi:hypothetical protein
MASPSPRQKSRRDERSPRHEKEISGRAYYYLDEYAGCAMKLGEVYPLKYAVFILRAIFNYILDSHGDPSYFPRLKYDGKYSIVAPEPLDDGSRRLEGQFGPQWFESTMEACEMLFYGTKNDNIILREYLERIRDYGGNVRNVPHMHIHMHMLQMSMVGDPELPTKFLWKCQYYYTDPRDDESHNNAYTISVMVHRNALHVARRVFTRLMKYLPVYQLYLIVNKSVPKGVEYVPAILIDVDAHYFEHIEVIHQFVSEDECKEMMGEKCPVPPMYFANLEMLVRDSALFDSVLCSRITNPTSFTHECIFGIVSKDLIHTVGKVMEVAMELLETKSTSGATKSTSGATKSTSGERETFTVSRLVSFLNGGSDQMRLKPEERPLLKKLSPLMKDLKNKLKTHYGANLCLINGVPHPLECRNSSKTGNALIDIPRLV